MVARIVQVWYRFKPGLIVDGVVAAAVGAWLYWQTTKPVGRVAAHIVLTGRVCTLSKHAPICRHLGHGGQVVIFGPSDTSGGPLPQHNVTLHSADETIPLTLPPGSYGIGCWIERPYRVLLPNFGTRNRGNFVHV